MTKLIVEEWEIGRLRPYERNPRVNDPAVPKMVQAIEEFGFRIPVVARSDGLIVDGHLRYKAAVKMGLPTVPVALADGLSEDQIRAFRLLANRSVSWAQWDDELLAEEMGLLAESGFDLSLTGFDEVDLSRLLGEDLSTPNGGETDPDDIPSPPVTPVTRRGDLWILGRHRLLCGDATQADAVARLFGGRSVDCVLTDPPYCSGGFQEAGRSAGSIGSEQIKKGGRFQGGIANDKLSTRGYAALLKAVLGLTDAPMAYVFTDWKMWVHLYDIVESCGLVTRSMIVWDKGTAGMGLGWRTQHELALFGARGTVKFDNHKAIGNVITCKRTGNTLHPTQKPVEIIEAILNVTDVAETIYDPFGGSGTTLIACEKVGRSCLSTELSPAFADVIVKRWQDFTGGEAVLEGDGRSFAEVAEARPVAAAAAG